jgi:hypothetical protein
LNRAIEELVTLRAGRSGWDAVRERAGVAAVGFTSIRPYPDAMTYDLISAAGHVLGRSRTEVLRALGRYWIQFVTDEGFGSLLAAGGRDLRDFLLHVDSLHARLGLTMPGLTPPAFVTEEQPEGVLHVHYYSQREGLAPMVVGLLESLGELFETPIHVSQVRERENPDDCDVFAVVPHKRESSV